MAKKDRAKGRRAKRGVPTVAGGDTGAARPVGAEKSGNTATNAVLNVADWVPLSPKVALSKLRQGLERRKSAPKGTRHRPPLSTWVNDGRLSPLDLYCYLKARFGDPNGTTMLFRHPSSDNLIQWHYALMCGGYTVDVFGMNARTELLVEGSPLLSSADWEGLAASIKADFATYGGQMSEVRRSLERWSLFINPYRRLDRITQTLAERIGGLHLEAPVLPVPPVAREQLEAWHQSMKVWRKAMDEAKVLGCSLRMLAPVFGEAFVNLLIFVLARPDVRSDDRLYQDLIRKQIDVRLKSLHLYCGGFARPIESSGEEFRDFQTLMNSRNDLLHGNVDPLKLEFDEVYFDGTIPLFATERSLGDRLAANSVRYIEPESALKDLDVVRRFVAFALTHLQPGYRKQVELVMLDDQPGWRRDTGKVGILLPPYIAEFIPTTEDLIEPARPASEPAEQES